jgi:hypothetical protein
MQNFSFGGTGVPQVPLGSGPVRIRKQPSLIQSILGIFIGIALVLASPVAMWMAQSQHAYKDFNSATVAGKNQSGYIRVDGAPFFSNDADVDACYQTECVYEEADYQELVTHRETVCQNNLRETETLRIISTNGSECDEDGTNCVPCYNVEKDEWETQSTDLVLNNFTVAGYEVVVSESAVYLDTISETVETGADEISLNPTRTVYESFVLPETVLVVGDSDGKLVTEPESQTFVISSYSVEKTAELLKELDRNNRLGLWLLTFGMLFIGYTLILGPLAWLGRKTSYIPVVGKMLKEGSKFMVGLVSALLAVVSWIVVFLLITILKFWWLALIALLIFIVLMIVKSKQKTA